MTPAEQAAEDREAAAVVEADREHERADELEARALVAEIEATRLRRLADVLERTALPRLDPDGELVPFKPYTAAAGTWAALERDWQRIDGEIALAREWGRSELDAFWERVEV